MTVKARPTVRRGGPLNSDSLGGRASLSAKDSTLSPTACQTLAHLRHVAELAQAEGDRPGYLLARRAYLLAQAAVYQAGKGGGDG